MQTVLANKLRCVITDHGFPNLDQEQLVLGAAGVQVVVAQCKSASEVIAAATGADALLVQFAPITSEVISTLGACRIIVRYGIGMDNVDLAAAKRRGIAVSNVPDYGVNEVAEHSLALALSLARQLPQINARILSGTWKLVPDLPMFSFSEMTFGTAGFGRIARTVHHKLRSLGFRSIAYDPFVSAANFCEMGVRSVGVEELFAQADILSLHLPLSPATHHFVSAERLALMKRTSIVVNTARGGLIDSGALVIALKEGRIAGAGLDVLESEPPSSADPLLSTANVILTSHVAWYSESSVPRLQRMAAEEALRGIQGHPLKYQMNK